MKPVFSDSGKGTEKFFDLFLKTYSAIFRRNDFQTTSTTTVINYALRINKNPEISHTMFLISF